MFSKGVLSFVTAALALTASAAPVEIEERAVSLKRGFAYNDASLTKLFTRSKINWAYNWDSKATGLPAGLQFVPMLWGTAADHTNQWNANANAALKSGSGQLLSFNEPDMAAQANLSPAAAATAYKNYMMPFKGKAKLGTPAVTNSGSKNQGLDWLKQFTAACTGCSFDFAAIHWYDTNGNFDYFKQYMTQAYAQTKLPIWITEFGFYGAPLDKQAAFLAEAIPWLDAQSFIHRYAYFSVDQTLTQNRALSVAGKKFQA